MLLTIKHLILTFILTIIIVTKSGLTCRYPGYRVIKIDTDTRYIWIAKGHGSKSIDIYINLNTIYSITDIPRDVKEDKE